MTALSILVVGLLLGMKHATEADHLAAVATLATRQGSLAQTLRQGVAWGVGHTLTLMLFGGAVLWLGQVDLARASSRRSRPRSGSCWCCSAPTCCAELVRDRIHFHVHRHRPAPIHVHAHSHRGEGRHEDSAHRHAHPKRWPVRALAVGMMHGLAGSAALVVLTLQTIPSVGLGVGYIALFGLGSIAGMAAAVGRDRGAAQALVELPHPDASGDDGAGRRLQLRPRRRHGGGDRLPEGAARLAATRSARPGPR